MGREGVKILATLVLSYVYVYYLTIVIVKKYKFMSCTYFFRGAFLKIEVFTVNNFCTFCVRN